jgi:tellurite resistance protein
MNLPTRFRLPAIPVSFFSIAVGLLALGNAWRAAVRLWALPAWAAAAVSAIGLVVWGALLVLYALTWLRHGAQARAELQHPLQSSFVALVPVSSLLAAVALQPLAPALGFAVFIVALLASLGIGAWLFGRIWQGGLTPELVTPAVYLPAVAQNFVAALAAAVFGWPQVGLWFFGAGLLSWLAIESTILNRLGTRGALPAAMRPLLGIQLAPPVVGGVAWMALGQPGADASSDLFAQALLGYGLYQALLLARLLPWIRAQGFTPSYWGFSFGVAALPTLAMRLAAHGGDGAVQWLAPIAFAVANAIVLALVVGTLRLWIGGRLLPAAAAPASSPAPAV